MDEREVAALNRDPLVLERVESSYDRRPEYWRLVSEEDWQSYDWQRQNRIYTADALENVLTLLPGERRAIEALAGRFPLVLSPHMAAMIRPALGKACPVRRQAIPSLEELNYYEMLSDDPLGERRHALSACATRRYPDRALIYVTHECAMRCRHCTRRSRVGLHEMISAQMLDEAIDDVISNTQIRDVLISGGDALSLDNHTLKSIIQKLRSCNHIDVIRLCTRMVCTQPQRIFDEQLLNILRQNAPVYVNTQFNHPFEVSEESARAIRLLRESGCIVGNQSVLLRGVNDRAGILEPLYRWLLREGCRPYYLFLCDVAQGTQHFRTSINTGLRIMEELRGRVSGLAIPHFVVDLPDGMGKVDLMPNRILSGQPGRHLKIQNWFDAVVDYEDMPDEC